MASGNHALTIAEEFGIKIRQDQKREKLTRVMPALILAALCIFFSAMRPQSFLTLYNFKTILNQLSITLIVAVGLTFVNLSGLVDLSVDGVVGLAGSAVSVLVLNSKNASDLGWFGVLLAVLIGAGCGLISGLIHTKLKITSFMVTYAMGSVATGFAIMSYGGHFATILDARLVKIPEVVIAGIPLITWVSLLILAAAWVIQEYTPFGRYVYAVGTDEALPRMTGIKVDRVKILVFVCSGVCMAVAGVIGAVRLGAGIVDIGIGQFFPAQAAVIVGGTSLAGGKGGVLNTLVGSLIITVLDIGLLLMGVNSYIRSGIQGVIIIVVLVLSVVRNRQTICK